MISRLNDFLRNFTNIKMDAEHVNLDWSKYPHDNWQITFYYEGYEGKKFSPPIYYKTGIGHRQPSSYDKPRIKKECGGYYHSGHSLFKNERDAIFCWFKPVQPDIADVLCAYLSDAKDSIMTFENWCSEFGYNSDSIKDLNTYLTCQKIRDGLINLFGYELFNKLGELEH